MTQQDLTGQKQHTQDANPQRTQAHSSDRTVFFSLFPHKRHQPFWERLTLPAHGCGNSLQGATMPKKEDDI